MQVMLMYRASFLMGAFSSFLWAMLSMVSITILTYQTSMIAGWTKNELYVVQGVYSLIFGFMYTFIYSGLERFIEDVKRGDLDYVLLKPIDSQFFLSFRFISFVSLARMITGTGILVFTLSAFNSFQVLERFPLFFLMIILSTVVVYTIWFSISTTSIWLIDIPGFSDLLFHLTGITRYPLEIMRTFGQWIFFVLVPLVVITTVPARAILGKNDWYLVSMSIGISFLLFGLSRIFFRYALRFYTSASS
jgi:ABC-2 type transport system permease protein